MTEAEVNFVGSGNGINMSSISNSVLYSLFRNYNVYNIGMSEFFAVINNNFELSKYSENDEFRLYTYESKQMNIKLKIRLSKEPDFIRLNNEEYNAILSLTRREVFKKRKGVVYNKSCKKVFTPGRIVLATLLGAVLVVGGIKIANDIKDATNDPNNILYNLTHYVSTVPDAPNPNLEQQQYEMAQKEAQETIARENSMYR